MLAKYTKLLLGIVIGILVGFLIANSMHQQKSEHTTQVTSSIPTSSSASKNTKPQGSIPQKAYDVWNYVKQHNHAMDGYVGGRPFSNREQQLQQTSSNGKRIHYQEWDVNPKVDGQNRGAERLITSDEERAFYTSDHYQTFTELN